MTIDEIIRNAIIGKTCRGPFTIKDTEQGMRYHDKEREMLIENFEYDDDGMYLIKGKINDNGEYHNLPASKSVTSFTDLGIITSEEMHQRRMKAIHDHFNSEEGKKSMEEYFSNIEARQKIKDQQVKRIHRIYGNNIDSFIEKLNAVYESKTYRDKWFSKGCEPPERLYWYLLDYAKKYGEKINRKTNKDLLETYGNMFTSSIYKVGSYVIQRMDGQGSVIRIDKIK